MSHFSTVLLKQNTTKIELLLRIHFVVLERRNNSSLLMLQKLLLCERNWYSHIAYVLGEFI